MSAMNNSDNVTMKRGIVGLVAVGALAAAVAAGALLAGCQDPASSLDGAGDRGAATEQADGTDISVAGQDNHAKDEESGGGAVEATGTPEPQPEPTEDPHDGGCQFCPEDVDDLAPQPTATPNGGCQFCPEDLDELAPLPTATPEGGCNFCPGALDIMFPPEPTPTPDCNFCNDDLDIVSDWP